MIRGILKRCSQVCSEAVRHWASADGSCPGLLRFGETTYFFNEAWHLSLEVIRESASAPSRISRFVSTLRTCGRHDLF